MTFEQRIDRLTVAIESLVTVLSTVPLITPAVKAQEQPKREPEAVTEPLKPADNPPTITHEELHDLCLSLVRKDRAKKNKIKAILAARNAELIKDVPESQFVELKAELEAL